METAADEKRVLAQFKSEDGVLVGTPFDLPLSVPKDSLAALCNAVLENVRPKTMPLPLSRFICDTNCVCGV